MIHGGNFYYYVKPDDKKQCGCFKLEGMTIQVRPKQNIHVVQVLPFLPLPESFINRTGHRKKYNLVCAPNEDSDQSAHQHSLIRVFVRTE